MNAFKKAAAALCAVMLAAGAVGCGNTDDTPAAEGTTAPAETQAAETTAGEKEEPETEEEPESEAEAETEVKTEEKAVETSAEKELSVSKAADKVSAMLEEVTQAANGELEGGYNASMTFTPGADIVAEMPELKTISMTVDAKMKDKLMGADYAFSYDSKPLISMQMVLDADKETGYFTVPDLSEGVLTASAADVQGLVEQNLNAPINPIAGTESGEAMVKAPKPDLEAIKNIDYEALIKDIASYADTFMENFPAPEDGGDYTLDSEGVSFDLKVKSYTVTPEDQQKIADALTEKLKADDQLKGLFTACGMTEEQFEEMWANVGAGSTEGETVKFDLYYYNDEAVGIEFKEAGGVTGHAFCVSDEEHLLIDCDLATDTTTAECKGLLTHENDVIDGDITLKVDDGNGVVNGVIEYNSIKATEDEVNGEVVMTVTVDGEELSKITMNMDANADTAKMNMAMITKGKDLGTFDVNVQKTDASDVKIPEGKAYKMTDENEMKAYLESCDIESFKANVKDALGEELFAKLFPERNGAESAMMSGTAAAPEGAV